MRWLLVVVGILMLVMLAGCSEKQKEASRMEQEVKDLEGGGDTSAGAAGIDSLAGAQQRANAQAVPDEAAPRRRPMPAAPAGVGYTVQVASCESEDFARHLVDVYTDRGYEPFVMTITYNDQTYYRVRLGTFPSLAEARALQSELSDRFSVQTWIDKVE
jgi:cell division septation protein DedD